MRGLLSSLITLCIGALAVDDAPAQALGETRIALVIANEAYQSPNLARLPATRTDAMLMSNALTHAGFQVIVRINLDRMQMLTELSAFEHHLADLGPQGVGFLYYSGHAIADPRRNTNYLIPVDARISGITDLPVWGLALDDQLDAIENAGAKASLVVIDASRNTSIALNRSTDRGLVAMSAETRTLIAFSAQPGVTVSDDNMYARVLADALATPGVDAVSVFQRVQSSVAHTTGERQIPFFDSGLVDPIVFVPGSAAPTIAEAPAPPASGGPPTSNRQDTSAARRPGDVFRDCPDCPEMVVLPPGTFLMGSPDGERGRSRDESPQHTVNIRQFAVGRYEVTLGQYATFVQSSSYASSADCDTGGANESPNANGSWRDPTFAQSDSHPVVCVSWQDAQSYVRWLNTQTRAGTMMIGNSSAGAYRLLTEAEWEYSARAGSSSAYPWGVDADEGCTHANGLDVTAHASYSILTWFKCDDGMLHTARVGSYLANAFGLYDMIGNASEWVQDCYNATYNGAPADGSAWGNGNCSMRVIRGGHWINGPRYLRSASRISYFPAGRQFIFGFRVAKTL